MSQLSVEQQSPSVVRTYLQVLTLYTSYTNLETDAIGHQLKLHRSAHVAYMHGCLGKLGPGFASLDASRPWICYW